MKTDRVEERERMAERGIAVLMVLVVVIIEIMGCGMGKDIDRENMLSFLESKYGEEFYYVEDYAGQAGKDYSMILARSRRHEERWALVRLSERDGEKYYEDNYLAYLLKEELEQKIGHFAAWCFGECKICYKIPMFVFPSYFRADMTADEFLEHPCSMPQFYIYPKDRSGDCKEWEAKADAFRKMNQRAGYRIRGTISLAASDRDYGLIDAENFGSGDQEAYSAMNEILFSMDEKGNFRYIRWKNMQASQK